MSKIPALLFAALAFVAAPLAQAQDDDLAGMEMDVMDADETPNEASTRILALPEEASDEARAASQFGLDTANAARQGGAEFGQGIAEAAREGAGGPPEGVPGGPPEDLPGPGGD
jgi:hypothetical protein